MKIYPNPAHDFIVIECTSETNKVKICTILGEVIFEESMGRNSRIDTKNWQKGVYFVYIADNQNNHALEKVIIY